MIVDKKKSFDQEIFKGLSDFFGDYSESYNVDCIKKYKSQ
jgi:hypothetical protein